MVGTYAEHLVARHLGGQVNDEGWGPVDDVWLPPDRTGVNRVDIQVKAARAFRTFGDGIVDNVTFSTRASRSLTDVWAQNDTPAARSDIRVFALHGSRILDGPTQRRWIEIEAKTPRTDALARSVASQCHAAEISCESQLRLTQPVRQTVG